MQSAREHEHKRQKSHQSPLSKQDTMIRHPDQAMHSLQKLLSQDAKVFVLSGAGCSTASGLGDYRDKQGQWKRAQPITGQTFRNDRLARHRYWARSSVGWPAFKAAKPNTAHHALATLERMGRVSHLVTQNVDELHQDAGHQSVIDLHGVLSTVSCIACGLQQSRDEFQSRLLKSNAWLDDLSAEYAPDGDADLEDNAQLQQRIEQLHLPDCPDCSNLLKPDVVFFGENVPKPRVELAMQQLREADVLMVAGSSLMVFSGFRFCRDAHQRKQPIVIVNNGATRADDMASLLIEGDCGERLSQCVELLKAQH